MELRPYDDTFSYQVKQPCKVLGVGQLGCLCYQRYLKFKEQGKLEKITKNNLLQERIIRVCGKYPGYVQLKSNNDTPIDQQFLNENKAYITATLKTILAEHHLLPTDEPHIYIHRFIDEATNSIVHLMTRKILASDPKTTQTSKESGLPETSSDEQSIA